MPKSRFPFRVVATASLFAYAFWRAKQGDWFTLHYFLAAIVVGGVIGAFLAPLVWRRASIKALRAEDARPARVSEWPQFDALALDALTQEWRELGFEAREDTIRGETNPQAGLIFSRLLLNPAEDAVVEMLQIALPSRVSPPSCKVASYYGDARTLREQASVLRAAQIPANAPLASPDAGGSTKPALSIGENDLSVWSMAASNFALQRGILAWRHARLVGERLDPDATPRELWDVFIARREWFETRLKESRLHHDLPEVSRNFTLVWRALMCQRLRGVRVIPLFWRARFGKPKNRAFWGELGEPPAL